MRKLFVFFVFLPLTLRAGFVESYSPFLRSLQAVLNDDRRKPPVMQLGSDDEISFSFDEMSHTYRRYIYKIVHCNADWTPSELFAVDYLNGFSEQNIDDWENSQNTTQQYTHYEFTLPNENVSFKLPGNYRVTIFDDDGSEEAPVASFGFVVLDRRVGVSAKVSGNTDIDFNTTHQQLSFTVDYTGYDIYSPASDIIPVVYQNRRHDNMAVGFKPTYITANTLQYVYNKELIFDAGNEYRRFEITDPYSPGMNVEYVAYTDTCFNVWLYADAPRNSYSHNRDENGRFFVNTLEGYGTAIEADYALVNFCLEAPYRAGGAYYLLGDAWGNNFTDDNKLLYDAEQGAYVSRQLLKFGVYNYNYVWLPSAASRSLTAEAEGDFYNTENEYLIIIYHRKFGERYDTPVGLLQINYDLEKN